MIAAEKIRAVHETVDQQKVTIAFQPIVKMQRAARPMRARLVQCRLAHSFLE